MDLILNSKDEIDVYTANKQFCLVKARSIIIIRTLLILTKLTLQRHINRMRLSIYSEL